MVLDRAHFRVTFRCLQHALYIMFCLLSQSYVSVTLSFGMSRLTRHLNHQSRVLTEHTGG